MIDIPFPCNSPQIVSLHHAPYSSGDHGSNRDTQWCGANRHLGHVHLGGKDVIHYTSPACHLSAEKMRSLVPPTLPTLLWHSSPCRPYEAWGADAVLAGHDHDYERLSNPAGVAGRDGFPYIVNGLGNRRL